MTYWPPVSNEAPPEQRNKTTSATSRGWPIRPIGPAIASSRPGLSLMERATIAVSIAAG